MTDPTLRLPNSLFTAVLYLGELPLNLPPLPPRFQFPELDADWDEETKTAGLFVGLDDGEFHMEIDGTEVSYHFHSAVGDESDNSPWSGPDTTALIAWGTRLAAHVVPLLPDLIADAEDAAARHREGLTVYARDFGPVPLEIVVAEMEGEQLMLPWLGSGHIEHEHVEGPNHPIALMWNPEHETPDIPIARAWLDPETDEPRAKAEPGVNWSAVGLDEADVVSWVESLYLNHHVLADPAQLIINAALNRIAGIDGFLPPA